MREKIEWIEPREAAMESRKHAASERLRGDVCQSLLLLLGGVFAALLFAPGAAAVVGLALAGGLIVSSVLRLLAYTASLRSGETTCVLDKARVISGSGLMAASCEWEQARGFEITDHATLPGIRTLSLQGEGASEVARLHFRVGQLDESELRAFVGSRIAAPIEKRLLRRVQM